MRFRTKLNVGMGVIIISLSVILAVFVTHIATQSLVHETIRRGQVLADNIALRTTSSMLSGDLLQMKEMVDELRTVDKDVAYAFLLNDSKQVLAHTFTNGFPIDLKLANVIPPESTQSIRLIDTGSQKFYDFAVPVKAGGQVIGQARLGLSRKQVHNVVNGLILTISLVTAITLLISIGISTQFAHRITYRLGVLGQYAESIVRGELGLNQTSGLNRNCWEIYNCNQTDCPAYGNTEQRCWQFGDTLCTNYCSNKSLRDLDNCEQCPVFAKNSGDEIHELAETFDVMSLSLRGHIADLESAQSDLTHQQEILHTILESSPDQLSLLDRHGKFVAVNQSFASFVGMEKDSIVGKQERDISSPLHTKENIKETLEILKSGRPVNKEVRVALADGSRKWFNVLRVPVHDEHKNSIGVLGTARDITDVKDYQNQLIHSQKLESVGKLAGGVAHEINTPLGIILGYAQLLQEDFPETEQVHKDLVVIEKQAKFCRKIVADLLNFSRQTKSQKKEMCFNNSIMEVVQLVRHAFKLDNVKIITNLDDRLPIIYGNPEQLKQVWMNLMSNAVEAIGHNGVLSIHTKLDIQKGTISAWFTDSGSGIAPHDIDSIFDPFFSTKPVGKGTGLGLSVSFGIIKDHGGIISAVSPAPKHLLLEEGETPDENWGPGTSFKVVFPLDDAEDDE
ncbi:MAG: PAS domain S-box protein [Desulfovibrionales bacterium]|nr:PAS domain S-box protein [Desulfovibrionales bacterium]